MAVQVPRGRWARAKAAQSDQLVPPDGSQSPSYASSSRPTSQTEAEELERQASAAGPAQPEQDTESEAGQRRKTLLCREHWAGKCNKIYPCGYAHGEEEQEQPINWEVKPKLKFCKNLRETGFCHFGRYCSYAHHEAEMKEEDRRKTQLCKHYFYSECRRGDACTYAHGEAQQRQPAGWQEKPKVKLCQNKQQTGFCEFGRFCFYAHDDDELQSEAPPDGTPPGDNPQPEQDDTEPEAGQGPKVLLCRHHAAGKCNKGDRCGFAHSEDEQEQPADWEEKPKVKPCSHFFEKSFCHHGRYCSFAHSEAELEERDPSRKTQLCKPFFEGYCPRGGICNYAHGEAEQRQPPGWQEKPKVKLCPKLQTGFCEFGRYCFNAHSYTELQPPAPPLPRQEVPPPPAPAGTKNEQVPHPPVPEQVPRPPAPVAPENEQGIPVPPPPAPDQVPRPPAPVAPENEQVSPPRAAHGQAGQSRKHWLCQRYWTGRCTNGDRCEYAHDENEQERPSNWEEKPKLKSCKNLGETGFCKFGRYCSYAHHEAELEERDQSRKTKLCQPFFEGTCQKGGNCNWAHGEAEQRQPPGWQEKPRVKPCEKFQNGFCEFGRYCFNAHDDAPSPPRHEENAWRKLYLCRDYELFCEKGHLCGFAHGEEEQVAPPDWEDKPKEELCLKFEKGFCKFGRYCRKAHGNEDLQESARRKTLLCKMHRSSFCWRGNDCAFAHGEDEQLPPPDYEEKTQPTKLCDRWYFSGFCARGKYCTFAHQRGELKVEMERPVVRETQEAREASPTLSEGDFAKVHGMPDEVDLNGLEVKLLAWEEDKKQWIIQLPNGRPRTLPQENLTPRQEAKAPDVDSVQGHAEGMDPLQLNDPWAAAKASGAKKNKMLLCSFNFQNKCVHGNFCEYAHTEDEQLEPPNYQARTSKNKMCTIFFPFGFCPRGKYCDYAHDPAELYKVKSEMCRLYLRGECRHGDKCTYAHGTNDLFYDKVGPLASVLREMLGDDKQGAAEPTETAATEEDEEVTPGLNEWGFPVQKAKMCTFYAGHAWCSKGIKCPYNHPTGPHEKDEEFEEGTLAEEMSDDPREPIKFVFIDSVKKKHEIPSSREGVFYWPMNYCIPRSGQKVYWNKRTKRVKVKASAESLFEREALLKYITADGKDNRPGAPGRGGPLWRASRGGGGDPSVAALEPAQPGWLDEAEVHIKLGGDEDKWVKLHAAAVFNGVPRQLQEEYCRSRIPLRAIVRFIFRDERVYLSAWLRQPEAKHLSHSGQNDEEYVCEIDRELSTSQEVNLEQKQFKALEKILDELDDVEGQLRSLRHDEHLAIAGLHPRSTGALEDFCRSVILDAFTRLVYKIQQPLMLLEHGCADEEGKKTREKTREWMLEVLVRGNYVWDLAKKDKKEQDERKASTAQLTKDQKALAQKQGQLERQEAEHQGQASGASGEAMPKKLQEAREAVERAQAALQVSEERQQQAEATCNGLGTHIVEKLRSRDGQMECPFCGRCFDPSAIDPCSDVGDIHPTNEEDFLRWILVQCLSRSCSESGFPAKPMIESWMAGVNKLLGSVSELKDEGLTLWLQHSSLELSEREAKRELKSPGLEGFKVLLRLKYGLRCSSTHGFAEPTLKDALSSFPTEVDLAARLLGVEPETTPEMGGFMGPWDMYWLESGKDDFDFRNYTSKGKNVDVRVRTNAYLIEEDSDGIKVSRKDDKSWWPQVTTAGRISEEGSTLRYNLHFCSLATLTAKPPRPHKWSKVELHLKSSDGYDYLDGWEHTRWDAEIGWSRREMHFSRGDRGRYRSIQFHRARILPGAPEGEEDRYEAAMVLAKQSRDLYQRIEHIERSATIYKCNVIADLSVTRITARLWADALADIVKKTFAITIAPCSDAESTTQAGAAAATEPDVPAGVAA